MSPPPEATGVCEARLRGEARRPERTAGGTLAWWRTAGALYCRPAAHPAAPRDEAPRPWPRPLGAGVAALLLIAIYLLFFAPAAFARGGSRVALQAPTRGDEVCQDLRQFATWTPDGERRPGTLSFGGELAPPFPPGGAVLRLAPDEPLRAASFDGSLGPPDQRPTFEAELSPEEPVTVTFPPSGAVRIDVTVRPPDDTPPTWCTDRCPTGCGLAVEWMGAFGLEVGLLHLVTGASADLGELAGATLQQRPIASVGPRTAAAAAAFPAEGPWLHQPAVDLARTLARAVGSLGSWEQATFAVGGPWAADPSAEKAALMAAEEALRANPGAARLLPPMGLLDPAQREVFDAWLASAGRVWTDVPPPRRDEAAHWVGLGYASDEGAWMAALPGLAPLSAARAGSVEQDARDRQELLRAVVAVRAIEADLGLAEGFRIAAPGDLAAARGALARGQGLLGGLDQLPVVVTLGDGRGDIAAEGGLAALATALRPAAEAGLLAPGSADADQLTALVGAHLWHRIEETLSEEAIAAATPEEVRDRQIHENLNRVLSQGQR